VLDADARQNRHREPVARQRYIPWPCSATEQSEPFVFERLEPRLLLSADGLVAPLADGLGADGLEHYTHQELPALDALRSLSLTVDSGEGVPGVAAFAPVSIDLDALARLYPALTTAHQSGAHSSVAAGEDAGEHSGRLELMIVDPQTPDYTSLLQDLAKDGTPNVEVLVLDTERDGVAQISEFIGKYHGVDALHLVSHGSTGGIQRGPSWLGADNVDHYRDVLTGWRWCKASVI
jgi:hypothetical protein